MRVNFPDDLEESISLEEAERIMREVRQFFLDNSYGTLDLEFTVTPLLTLPREKGWYAALKSVGEEPTGLMADARRAAEAAGFSVWNFDLDCVHLKPRIIAASVANVGRRGAWLQDTDARTICHELGHNFGLHHANGWKTRDTSIIGEGANSPYANVFDVMGTGRSTQDRFSVFASYRLNWLPDWAVQKVPGQGTYRLYPFDIATLTEGRTYALRIPTGTQREYWIETRRFESRPHKQGSLLVNWSPWDGSAGGPQLLDMTPGSEGGFYDAELKDGASFYDPELGVKIMARKVPNAEGAVDVLVRQVEYFTTAANPEAEQDEQAFHVEVAAPDDYAIWCRVTGPVSAGTVALNDQLWSELLAGPSEKPGPRWVQLPGVFALNPGKSVVRVRGFTAEQILVTNDRTTNIPPVFSQIPDQAVLAGAGRISVPFIISDLNQPLASTRLTASASNAEILPATSLEIRGTGSERELVISLGSVLGSSRVTVKSVGAGGISSQTSFELRVIGSVQAMIDAAASGDTVFIPGGSFVDQLVIDKDLTLQGWNTAETVIDGADRYVTLTVLSNATVTVRNLTLRNGRGGLRNLGRTSLFECRIEGHRYSARGGGIWNSGSLYLQDTLVSGNQANLEGGGIYNEGELAAVQTTISENRAITGGGIASPGNTSLEDCLVSGNEARNGVDPDLRGHISWVTGAAGGIATAELITQLDADGAITVILVGSGAGSWLLEASGDFITWEPVAVLQGNDYFPSYTEQNGQGGPRFFRALARFSSDSF